MRYRVSRLPLRPDAFASVMATGIVSISAIDHHYHWISDVLAALSVAAMVALTGLTIVKTVAQPRFPFPLTDPDVVVRLFTFVAACTVLAARFKAYPGVLVALTAIAWLAWFVLIAAAARSMRPYRGIELRDRACGVWELVSVATSGLAIVTAQLALLGRALDLFVIGIMVWLLAIGFYGIATWLILWRTAVGPSDDVWRPDSWILMGGMAIGTLAGDELHRAGLTIVTHDWVLTAVRSVTVVTWVAATLWIPVLVYMTLRHLDLRFTGSWFATVFPLGMYSAATFTMTVETGWRPFETASLVFFWIAFATWLLVVVAGIGALRRVRAR